MNTLQQDLERVEIFDGTLLEASARKPYTEIRTREVEYGYVQEHELKEPYPYRVYCDLVYSILLQHPDGRQERKECKWVLLTEAEGGLAVLIYDEEKILRVEINEATSIEMRHDSMSITTRQSEPPR